MKTAPRTVKSDSYPKFIRDNKTLAKYQKQKRVWSKIGLSNCKEKFGNATIVFSGSGNQALWDLATMSMRGISSCQSWGGWGGYRDKLIGSMTDPFCGIIYTTNGVDHRKRGAKMLKRAVVRFVINCQTKKPAILIERIYPSQRYNWLQTGATKALNDVFANFIKHKTKNKFPIITSKTGHYIPLSKSVDELDYGKRSYRGSWVATTLMHRTS